VLNTTVEGGFTTASGSLFPCLIFIFRRLFSLSSAIISSDATPDCCPYAFHCAPLRGSPPSSRRQQLEPPHPSPVCHNNTTIGQQKEKLLDAERNGRGEVAGQPQPEAELIKQPK